MIPAPANFLLLVVDRRTPVLEPTLATRFGTALVCVPSFTAEFSLLLDRHVHVRFPWPVAATVVATVVATDVATVASPVAAARATRRAVVLPPLATGVRLHRDEGRQAVHACTMSGKS